MRSKKELNKLRKALHIWNAKILYISEEISAKAMFYVEQHFLSHSMQLADALIGATAIAYGIPILKGNDKHYKVMKDLQIKGSDHNKPEIERVEDYRWRSSATPLNGINDSLTNVTPLLDITHDQIIVS